MKSKVSFIDTGILLNDLKRFAWIGVGYLLGMMLALPLMLIMTHSSQVYSVIFDPYAFLRILQFNATWQVVLLILVPILAGLWLFRYLQDNKAADMIHILPVRRETLYNTHILAGLILLFVPLIMSALAAWGVAAAMNLPNVYGRDVLAWLALALLFSLVLFITSVGTGMITGMSSVQGVLTVIVLLLPMGLRWLLISNYNMYSYGFAYDYYYDTVSCSPLARMNSNGGIAGITSSEVAIYLLAVVALYFIGRYLYQRRPLESAGSAITIDWLKPVFKYGVVFCCMLFLGSYFHNTQNWSMNWTYFGYLLGSLLSYLLVEMLMHKSINIFHWQAIKGYLIFAAAIAVVLVFLHSDIGVYEKRIPALAEIESVKYSEISDIKRNQNRGGLLREIPPSNPEVGNILPDFEYKEGRDIENIVALHRQIIDKRPRAVNGPEMRRILSGENSRRVFLDYKLKDGSHIHRQYIIDASQFGPVLRPIFESLQYKLSHNPILQVDAKQAKMMEIRPITGGGSARLIDEQKIGEAIAALQTDVMNKTYEDTISAKSAWASITIYLPDSHQVGLEWAKSYASFEAWLKKNGEYEKARVMPTDIQYVLVVNGSKDGEWAQKMSSNNQYVLELENRPGRLKITDPQNIEACLRSYYNSNKQPYWAAFVLKDGSTMFGGFKEEDAPDFIIKHFSS
ncbi:MAG: DUF6449 domain-containing protein [Syntrophomonas sp.]